MAKRPGYQFQGFIETPQGQRTTPQRQEEVHDIIKDAVAIARDKVTEGGRAGLRVDRIVSSGSSMKRIKGASDILD